MPLGAYCAGSPYLNVLRCPPAWTMLWGRTTGQSSGVVTESTTTCSSEITMSGRDVSSKSHSSRSRISRNFSADVPSGATVRCKCLACETFAGAIAPRKHRQSAYHPLMRSIYRRPPKMPVKPKWASSHIGSQKGTIGLPGLNGAFTGGACRCKLICRPAEKGCTNRGQKLMRGRTGNTPRYMTPKSMGLRKMP